MVLPSSTAASAAQPVVGPDLFGRFHWGGRVFDTEIAAERVRRETPTPPPKAGRALKIPPVPSDALTLRDRTLGIRDSKGAIAAAITRAGARYVLEVGHHTVGEFDTAIEARTVGRCEVARLEAARKKGGGRRR